MQFDEMGNRSGKTLMLLPGTACDYQTNFGTVVERLGEQFCRAADSERECAVPVLKAIDEFMEMPAG